MTTVYPTLQLANILAASLEASTYPTHIVLETAAKRVNYECDVDLGTQL